jgi:RNA polymerase sigma-70 factor (ECF subfamily)
MDLGRLTQQELVRRCRNGEQRAWRELSKRYAKLVYALTLRVLRNAAEADDATQETFVRVHRYFDRFDSSRPIEPWLSSIAYNVCLRRLQGVARAPVPSEQAEEMAVECDEEAPSLQEGDLGRGEEASLLQRSLEELAAMDRAILHMHYWQGLNTVEVAEAVDMPVNTVKVRLFRARNKLRELLAPELEEERSWT